MKDSPLKSLNDIFGARSAGLRRKEKRRVFRSIDRAKGCDMVLKERQGKPKSRFRRWVTVRGGGLTDEFK
jgi:hypothetical protein